MGFSLDDFVRESNRIEGIRREPSGEEVVATATFLSRARPSVSDVIDLVKVYQPDAKPRFVQGLDVRVGNHVPPRGGPNIQDAFVMLMYRVAERKMTAYEAHVTYETLHPFTDGNGRSGRAIWLWHMGGIDKAPLGFLHHFYYQALQASRDPMSSER